MATGPGKYDAQATYVRETSGAQAVVVIVLEGSQGSGFSVQAHEHIQPEHLASLLEMTAAQIRGSHK